MTNSNLNIPRTLEEQRREFALRRGLAMPLAGGLAWTIVAVAGAFLPPIGKAWVLFGATGLIAGLGIFFSRFTGENFLDKQRPKNMSGIFWNGLVLREKLCAASWNGRRLTSRRRGRCQWDAQ